MIRDAATQRQVDAADPTRSTWLSANAGSGKTRVLTDRVARLLLDGVPPDHILCLTYTKAAASEMQNRLFKRLGDWAMLDDGALRSALTDLGAEAGSSERLAKARRLFASAIETPGGLRIQTIHSFCSGLLRRFPLEAGVSPQFTEIEDRAAERLRAEILDQIATGSDSQVLDDVATVVSDLTFEDLAARVVGARGAFAAQGPTDSMTEGVIRAAYDLPDGLTPDALVSQLLGAADLDVLAAVRPILAASGANDQKAAAKLAQVTPDLAGVMMLETVVLSGPKAKIPLAAKVGSLPTKALVNTGKMDAWLPAWDDLMRRVEKARPLRLGLMAADRDMRLHRFATAFLPRYERAKQQRGWLDFDDLITRTEALLRDPVVAQWVLFRLDGAIDHILVDEAQDTSPTQWSVIARLAHEFTTGEGARADVLRTIFVVGDKKQSIYSFQGADAAEFDRMQADFADRLAGVGATLQTTSLAFSFRSAAEVLSVVDATFEGRAGSGFDGEPHAAFKTALPGRVDLWPVVPRAEAPDDTDWRAPVDHISPEHHTVRLARRIAQTVARMMADGTRLPLGDGASRPVTAGDVLILVRRRSALFGEIIRACKACGLPMAGADRFKVMAELAVRDIIAVLRFIDTAEDDLSLATALRSPLFGLDEQALFDLAHRRPAGASLWETLRGQADAFRPVLDVLDDLRGQADFLRPYDLIERLLIRHAGRARLVGRLGAEAEDGIDALLGQALAYEQTEIPTLTGFLQWAQSDALEIKRETASGEGKLRVMTVHGSKGLEAPIVILPDCTKPSTPRAGALAADERGVMWPLAQADQPPRQQARAQQAQQAAAAEWDRLLYVAMTRAETWLMVAAVDDLGKDGRDWYSQVRQGMERVGATAHMFDFGEASGVPDRGEGLRFEGAWPVSSDEAPMPVSGPATPKADLDTESPPTLPDWAERPTLREAPPVIRSPSDLGGAKALPGLGDTTDVAKARGTAVHALLEHLPQVPGPDRAALAARLLPEGVDLPPILSEACAVLDDPALAHVFAPDTLAEVPVTGDVPGLGRLHGVIDRLIVMPDRVIVVDIKTNRQVPPTPQTCPEGVLRQMGAYAALVAPVFADRPVHTAILWTCGPVLMDLMPDLVDAALARAQSGMSGRPEDTF